MSITGNPAIDAAVIAASAALGAAFFAFIAALLNAKVARDNAVRQVIIAQRSKRAEFRQVWISQLRDSFSKFQASCMAGNVDQESAEHAVRILFLMNREDPDYERLREAVQKIIKMDVKEQNNRSEILGQYIAVCQDILKREWRVVKDEISHFDESLK